MKPEPSARSPQLFNMGESGLLVAFEQRIDPRINDRVLGLAQALGEQGKAALTDLVPAYCSLLIRFDPSRLPEDELRHVVARSLKRAVKLDPGSARTHVLDVRYGGEDGPDLDSLASRHKLSADEAVGLHASRDYRVYFVGFTPGFGYLGTVQEQIATQRLATPRQRVPAGSVGIAGSQTGCYPLASPGGWNIIGRTGSPLWDIGRTEPSLLRAGDTVRFRPSTEPQAPPTPAVTTYRPPQPSLLVAEAHGIATVQDLGRQGHGAIGVSGGGAADPAAAVEANLLGGNEPGLALLEITAAGPVLTALRTLTIANTGQGPGCLVDGRPVRKGLSWLVRAGQQISFASATHGLRSYLAVAGGIDVPLVLASRSTYVPARFGGQEGRLLGVGDVLGTLGDVQAASVAGSSLPDGDAPSARRDEVSVLRCIPYRGPASAMGAWPGLLGQVWAATDRVDRMGVQLEREDGTGLIAQLPEALSFGVVRGAIQLPPDGRPFVLGPDHLTTGGYPLLGVVIEVDWHVLAQVRPGAKVRFVEVTAGAARDALSAMRLRLTELEKTLRAART